MLFECYFWPAPIFPLHNEMWHYYRLKSQLVDSMKEAVACNHVMEGSLPMFLTVFRFYISTFVILRAGDLRLE